METCDCCPHGMPTRGVDTAAAGTDGSSSSSGVIAGWNCCAPIVPSPSSCHLTHTKLGSVMSPKKEFNPSDRNAKTLFVCLPTIADVPKKTCTQCLVLYMMNTKKTYNNTCTTYLNCNLRNYCGLHTYEIDLMMVYLLLFRQMRFLNILKYCVDLPL